MYSFVAKQPILDNQKVTVAYELLFRNGLTNSFPHGVTAEEATVNILTEEFLNQPIDKLVGDKLCFINFPYSLIVSNLVDFLPVNQVVIEILENSKADDSLLESIKQLKNKGFKIALDDFTMEACWDRFLPYVDIIKFDFKASTLEEIKNYIASHRQYPLSYLAEKIETIDEFIFAQNLGFSLYQGFFFSKPQIVQHKTLSQNQLAVIQLMQEVNNEDLDYGAIEELLKRDLSLAYKLLRYVNNVRESTEPITSFKQASVYLGKLELKRFVALISATSLGSDVPSEVYRLSLTRAHFCEQLAKYCHNTGTPDEAFLCGLFSLLEPIVGQPIADIIAHMPITDNIKNAIIYNQGELAFFLNFIRDYERFDFEAVKGRASMIGLTDQDAIKFYQQATEWTDQILHE